MNVFFAHKGSKHFLFLFCMEIQRPIIENVYNFCLEERVGREAMPEPVLINLVSDDDNSLTGSAWDLSRYEIKL